MAVRSLFQSERLFISDACNIEAVFVKIIYLQRSLFICGLYIPSGIDSLYYDNVTLALNLFFEFINPQPSD